MTTPATCPWGRQAYNDCMKTAHTSARNARLTAASAVLAIAASAAFAVTTPARAQAPVQPASAAARADATTPAPAQVKTRPDSNIERIRTEDAGSRIDELRVGGETQSITVQPKTGNAPAYEVKQSESARGNPPNPASGETNGSRVWNVFKF